MKKRHFSLNLRTALAPLAASALLLLPTACTDNSFDLSNIDALIGLGGDDTLQLPGNNSTRAIKLDDVLKLNNSNFVKIADNGDYTLQVTDNSTHNQTAQVSRIELLNASTVNGKFLTVTGTHEATLASFAFLNHKVDDAISALNEVWSPISMSMKLTVPGNLKQISQLKLQLPTFLHVTAASFGGKNCTVADDNIITLSNVATGSHTLSVTADRITFGTNGDTGYATFNASTHQVSIEGKIVMGVTLKAADFSSTTAGYITGNCSIEPVYVTRANGRFAPAISYESLGTVHLNGIPSFLQDSQIRMDLYNPMLSINFSNELPMRGLLSGDLVAYDARGNVLAKVNVPEFKVPQNTGVVVIEKQNEALGSDTTTVVVPTLSNLLTTIPAKVEFENIKAKGDDSQTATIEMGHPYTISARYGFNCKLQFDDDAKIVYTDSVDDMNDGVKDLQFKEVTTNGVTQPDGYLTATADIDSYVPVYLNVEAWGTDLNGDTISSKLLAVTTDKLIAASPDGNTKVTTHLTITIKPYSNSVFKNLDGLRFRLTGLASDGSNPVSGVTVNAYKQTLTVRNFTVTKHGKLVGNFN